jgi:murein DD-endopeptidase MepM/ murein hydrolase activator NlpD
MTYYQPGHYAMDIANRSKPPIWASASGTVVKTVVGCGPRSTSCGGGYGNHIIIDHGNGYKTLYAHCEELYVKEGDTVTQGQVIAKMGNSGRVRGATGIHLHFTVYYNGAAVNPVSVGAW